MKSKFYKDDQNNLWLFNLDQVKYRILVHTEKKYSAKSKMEYYNTASIESIHKQLRRNGY